MTKEPRRDANNTRDPSVMGLQVSSRIDSGGPRTRRLVTLQDTKGVPSTAELFDVLLLRGDRLSLRTVGLTRSTRSSKVHVFIGVCCDIDIRHKIPFNILLLPASTVFAERGYFSTYYMNHIYAACAERPASHFPRIIGDLPLVIMNYDPQCLGIVDYSNVVGRRRSKSSKVVFERVSWRLMPSQSALTNLYPALRTYESNDSPSDSQVPDNDSYLLGLLHNKWSPSKHVP